MSETEWKGEIEVGRDSEQIGIGERIYINGSTTGEDIKISN